MITQEHLKKILHYSPDTGHFTWASCSRASRVGVRAGGDNGKGYIRIRIDKRLYVAHRLAWLYIHGRWPSSQIDHIDHDRSNNAILNLREVTAKVNHKNRRMSDRNKSGLTGVMWNKQSGKWQIQIGMDNRNIHLGVTDSFFEASCIRKSAELRFGYHPNHGQDRQL